jgi:hypothetical protein
MARQMKPAANNLYQDDFSVWSRDHVELLRERRFDELDLANLVEEVEDLGGALRRSGRLHVMTIVEHLLKLQQWPESERRLAWREAVRRERSELDLGLRACATSSITTCPSFTHALGTTPRGRCAIMASRRPPKRYPRACLYTFDQITGDWLP